MTAHFEGQHQALFVAKISRPSTYHCNLTVPAKLAPGAAKRVRSV